MLRCEQHANERLQEAKKTESPKTMAELITQEAEGLETPANSVEFLQYMKKHAKLVQKQKARLSSISSLMFGLGITALAYGLFVVFQKQ